MTPSLTDQVTVSQTCGQDTADTHLLHQLDREQGMVSDTVLQGINPASYTASSLRQPPYFFGSASYFVIENPSTLSLPRMLSSKLREKILNFILQSCQKETAPHESTSQGFIHIILLTLGLTLGYGQVGGKIYGVHCLALFRVLWKFFSRGRKLLTGR